MSDDSPRLTDSEKSEQLAALVSETLQRRGVLGDLKAKVRAEVFLALEEQSDQSHDEATWVSNPGLQQLATEPAALRTLTLVHEFLACYGLHHTKSVLEAECPVVDAVDVHFEGNAQKQSTLVSMLQKQPCTDGKGGLQGEDGAHSVAAVPTDQPSANTGQDRVIEGFPAEVSVPPRNVLTTTSSTYTDDMCGLCVVVLGRSTMQDNSP